MLDLIQLLPHSKKDAKLDTKSDRQVINEVADMKVMPHHLCPLVASCLQQSLILAASSQDRGRVSFVCSTHLMQPCMSPKP